MNDDYISRADVLKERQTFAVLGIPDLVDAVLIEDIEAIPAADVRPVWISVADKLPEKERAIYLCFTDAGVVCECRWTNNRFGLGESENWGWSLMDTPQYQKVTHWMPLPEPPEGGADG